MTVQEKKAFQVAEYAEAMRYMDNAKETLKKSKKDEAFYADRKYVRSACGTAYSGVLVALDAWLTLKGVEVPQPEKKKKRVKGKKSVKDIKFYTESVAKLDGKMLNHLDSAYYLLHLCGYYDGFKDIKTIQSGFEKAYWIIDQIKPAT